MKTIFRNFTLAVSFCLLCVGCYQASSNGDDDLITTPVTNNPNFIPEGESFGRPSVMSY